MQNLEREAIACRAASPPSKKTIINLATTVHILASIAHEPKRIAIRCLRRRSLGSPMPVIVGQFQRTDPVGSELSESMASTIAVAGATGNLGKRVVKALLERGGEVIALARAGTGQDKVTELTALGARVAAVDLGDAPEIAEAIKGAECFVSVVAGLRDVVVGTQTVLLEAALLAGIPRFIPSDFSTDFTKLTPGENRNFDLRREFHQRLDVAPIASTAIFNGAFGEILTYNVPLLDFKKKVVGYWENPDWHIDFTTMDDTAAFTAAAALDPDTPKELHIASFQVSPNELVAFTAKTFGTPYELVRLGSLEELRAHNKRERAAHPEGEKELYASWQQSQYMQSMFSTHSESLDNDRYSGIAWTKLESLIKPR
jgi:nucleoside-diphosphate-sugar epimerase